MTFLGREPAGQEPSLRDALRDHRYQFRLEQVHLIETHSSESQRIKEAVALIREVAMQRVLSNFTVVQETCVLERLFSLVPPETLENKPPFGLGAYNKIENRPLQGH